MIQRIKTIGQSYSWQKSLSEAFTQLPALLDYLQLSPEAVNASTDAAQQFKCLVPLSFAQRMEKGQAQDPLLLQILPSSFEMLPTPGYVKDPVGDLAANPLAGVLHKYAGRVLLLTNGGCAAHCRYCFRRHFPYQDNNLSNEQWQNALKYIAADNSINEVIFSGGDPLLNKDQRLESWIQQLSDIPHLTRIRFHTRLPIFLPERINASLIRSITSSRLNPILVIHCNHPNEINAEVKQALISLNDAKILLLNQSVLLRNINDKPQILQALSERLFEAKTLPYYLHLLDPVAGAAHFNVEIETARQLYAQLCERLPGFLVPKLTQEKAGAKSKIGISADFQL